MSTQAGCLMAVLFLQGAVGTDGTPGAKGPTVSTRSAPRGVQGAVDAGGDLPRSLSRRLSPLYRVPQAPRGHLAWQGPPDPKDLRAARASRESAASRYVLYPRLPSGPGLGSRAERHRCDDTVGLTDGGGRRQGPWQEEAGVHTQG